MTLATIENVTYSYPRGAAPALREISLTVDAGEFSLVAGPSGGGKSTLLRLFNGLVPHFHGGTISGRVTVAGQDAIRTSPRQLANVAGMVFQVPEAQAIAETVLDEVAFGMEQRAVPRDEMVRRVDRVLAEMGVEHLRYRRLATLSGGERQRVAVAAVLALEPSLLLLDEPTSQLDGQGAASLLQAVIGLQRRRDLAVLMAEHRTERVLASASRVVHVASGTANSISPLQALGELEAVPAAAALLRKLGLAPQLSLDGARRALPAGLRGTPASHPTPGDVLVRARGVSVSFGEHAALKDVSFDLREGEIVALIGDNGSGKSTLFRALTGLVRARAGSITFPRAGDAQPKATRDITTHAGLVPQDPSIALFRESVRDEIAETLGLRSRRRPGADEVADALDTWNITEFAERNPRDISVGQQQRVAIAAMLAHGPRAWLLDEPTRGADARAKDELAARLRRHAAAGGAAIVATHDVESAAQFATRVISIDAGVVTSDLPAHEAFAAAGPHPTQVARLVPGATTVAEVVVNASN